MAQRAVPESNSGAMNEEGAAEYRLKQDTAALNGSFLHDQIDHFDQVRANLVNLVNLVT